MVSLRWSSCQITGMRAHLPCEIMVWARTVISFVGWADSAHAVPSFGVKPLEWEGLRVLFWALPLRRVVA